MLRYFHFILCIFEILVHLSVDENTKSMIVCISKKKLDKGQPDTYNAPPFPSGSERWGAQTGSKPEGVTMGKPINSEIKFSRIVENGLHY